MDEKEIKAIIPEKYLKLIEKRDGAFRTIKELRNEFPPNRIVTQREAPEAQRIWELIGLIYKENRRYFEAIKTFVALYEHMIKWQITEKKWTHKGMPLVWISDIFKEMGYLVLAKRYLMLTLIEDAIREKGKLSSETSGVYFRLVWVFGMSDDQLIDYQNQIMKNFNYEDILTLFPEYVLKELDQEWMIEYPSQNEINYYLVNPLYIESLINNLGDGSGKYLEHLASYLSSCMPGCKTNTRMFQKGNTTDYDVVCSLDGLILDFRSELGRYFVCECKDWNSPANFTTMAKFCRILTSVKARFGIIFSKNGLSGENEGVYAEREQLKIFQDSGIIIVVVDLEDIKKVKNGHNFISLIKKKYEKVRLDLK